MRKFLFAFLLVASPAFAQDQSAAARSAAGCGLADVEFSQKTNKSQHPMPQPDPGKALVYILEEVRTDGLSLTVGDVTARVGLDGHWMGATGDQSYLFFTVDPGDHHICTDWQSGIEDRAKLGAAASLTVEAGKIYHFRITVNALTEHNRPFSVKLERIDPAEAEFFISSYGLSASHPKK